MPKWDLWDLNHESGEKAAADIGGESAFSLVDVSDETSVAQAVEHTVGKFGGIDIAVSCAGIADPAKMLNKDGPVDMRVWTKHIKVNLIGAVNIIRNSWVSNDAKSSESGW